MNELLKSRLSPSLGCVDKSIAIAEPELAAFIAAVTESFGPEMAKVAADEWVQEVLSIDSLPEATNRGWRRLITLKVLGNLVDRTSGYERWAVGA